MSPRPALRHESTRQRIHGAARRLFARYGFAGVGLQRIAESVGLHKSSLFHHYKGKVDLAGEVFDAATRRLLAHVAELADEDEPELATLLEVVDRLVDHFSEHPDDARLAVQAMTAPIDSDLRAELGVDNAEPAIEFLTIIWQWLERAKGSGAIRAVNLRQALFNLIGLVTFYPAAAELGPVLAGPEPFSAKARKIRKRELRYALTGMLAPV